MNEEFYEEDDELTIDDVIEFIVMEAMTDMDLTDEEILSDEVNEVITLLLEELGAVKDEEKAIATVIDECEQAGYEISKERIVSLAADIIENCPLCIEAIDQACFMSRNGVPPLEIHDKVREFFGY